MAARGTYWRREGGDSTNEGPMGLTGAAAVENFSALGSFKNPPMLCLFLPGCSGVGCICCCWLSVLTCLLRCTGPYSFLSPTRQLSPPRRPVRASPMAWP